MAGRGRGRGVGSFTFNIEALGLSRGMMPEATLGPKPLYPEVEFKPLPLKMGEDEEYMLALKQEMRSTMKRLPYNIPLPEAKAAVERYKEKYTKENQAERENKWTPDWQRLPKELMPGKKIKIKAKVKKKPVVTSSKEKDEMLTKFDELEKKDKSDEEKGDPGEGEGEEEEEGEELEGAEFDEEELEEENDYIASYFEGGEDYGDASDENMDEATY